MSSYFDQVEQRMGEAVERLSHKPWYVRATRRASRRPGLAAVLVGLVIVTPAVGAVTHWYGIGATDHPTSPPYAADFGNAIPRTGRLLALRVPDPRGGPAWGVKYVKTQHGSCEVDGRVEDGKLGTLGLDGYWYDDHLFHPIPNNWVGGGCESPRTQGFGFGEIDQSGNLPNQSGSPTRGCNPSSPVKECPPGSQRLIMSGNFGPDVATITYREPNGSTRIEHTGLNGAFLLIFPANTRTCRMYFNGRMTKSQECVPSPSRTLDPLSRAITHVRLSDGNSCEVKYAFSGCRGRATKSRNAG